MKRVNTFGPVAGVLVALLATTCASNPSDSGLPAKRFGSADAAVEELIAALRAGDMDEAAEILGGRADDVLRSGDEVADRNGIATFLASYDEKHRLVPGADGGTNLVVGSTDWPMPIPLVEEDGGWFFDTEAGLDELLSRRIGRNELDAMQVCLAIVDAQREFASSDPDGDGVQEYARKFLSDEGKYNGLYWPAKAGEPQSPLGLLVAEADEQGYARQRRESATPIPYHGYFFRLLESQGPSADGGEFDYVVNGRMLGGFAVVAYPAEYANSGIMTFMVNHAGTVFEKDLGDMTPETARQIKVFSPGAGWKKVQ